MVRPPTVPPPPSTTGSEIVTDGNPVIKGKAKIGRKLSVRLPTFTPSSVTTKLVWKRNGKTIKGATKKTYKVTGKDRNTKMSVVVTVSRPGYQTRRLTSIPVKVKK